MSEASHAPGFHPLYQQVKELLIQRVLLGDWKPGELLPSETKLAVEYQVSQGTVRKALEEMAAEHLVVRHQGKGTFVTARSSGSPVHFFSVVTLDNKPVDVGLPILLDWEEREANERELRDLALLPGKNIYHIFRVRPIEGRPALIERIAVDSTRFRGLPELLGKTERMNTYLIMEKEFGVLVVHAREWIKASLATEKDEEVIGVPAGRPIMVLSRISYGLDGKPVEARTMRFSTEKVRYFNERH